MVGVDPPHEAATGLRGSWAAGSTAMATGVGSVSATAVPARARQPAISRTLPVNKVRIDVAMGPGKSKVYSSHNILIYIVF
jgi:hypothetical protein